MRRLGRDDSFYLAVLWVIPEELRTSDLCMKACQQSGSALREVPEKLITSDLCMAACQQNGGALEYVPEELRTSDVCMGAATPRGSESRSICTKKLARL